MALSYHGEPSGQSRHRPASVADLSPRTDEFWDRDTLLDRAHAALSSPMGRRTAAGVVAFVAVAVVASLAFAGMPWRYVILASVVALVLAGRRHLGGAYRSTHRGTRRSRRPAPSR